MQDSNFNKFTIFTANCFKNKSFVEIITNGRKPEITLSFFTAKRSTGVFQLVCHESNKVIFSVDYIDYWEFPHKIIGDLSKMYDTINKIERTYSGVFSFDIDLFCHCADCNKVIRKKDGCQECDEKLERAMKEINSKNIKTNFNYLYVIFNPDSKLYKIGVTDNPIKRLSAIKCATGSDCEILKLFPEMKLIETKLHRLLKEYRRNGEWFVKNNTIDKMVSGGLSCLLEVIKENNLLSLEEINLILEKAA